jgi:hypothetical protein
LILDWKDFEKTWIDAIVEGIGATASAHPHEQFYAGAIWLLYGDYSSIHSPAFGLNAESTNKDIRWHPPDWRWSPIELVLKRVQRLYTPLAALNLSDDAFEVLWDRHIQALASVSRQATTLVRAGKVPVPSASFNSTFFVGIVDFSQDDADELLQLSVDEQILADSGILKDLAS